MNPAEWLKRTATRAPERPALFSGEVQRATYGDFNRSAAAIGAALAVRGIGPGSRVAVFMSNCTEYLETLYGIWYSGAAAVPINSKLHPKEAEWIIGNSEAALVMSDEKLGKDLAPLLPDERRMVSVDSDAFAAMRAELRFPGDVTGRITCSLFSTRLLELRCVVEGESGRMEVLNPLAPQYFNWLRVRNANGVRRERVRGEGSYTSQLRAFLAAVREGAPLPTGPQDALANMRVIDAAYEKSGLGRRGPPA